MIKTRPLLLVASLGLALSLSACEEAPHSTNADARAAMEAGQLRDAEATIGGVFEAGSANTETQRLKLAVMLRLGDGYAAMAAIDALPESALNGNARRVARAHAYLLQGKPQEAANLYEGLKADDFSEQDFRMTLWALRDLEMGEEFEAGMDAGLEAYPESADLNTMAAQVLIELDVPQEAVAYADRALSSDPDHFDALLVKGELAIAQDDLESALSHYQAASKVYPDFALPLANIAGLQLDLKRIEAAGETLKAALQADADEPFVQWQLARHALATGDIETARLALENARRAFRDVDEFTLLSARAEETFGNRELALAEYKRYLRAVGKDEAIEAKVSALEAQG